MKRPLTFLGDPSLISGTYLLHIEVLQDLEVIYGRCRQARPVPTPVGQYLYIGSAMSEKGPASLPRRLLRHTTRAVGEPQPIQQQLVAEFRMTPPSAKRLRWHVDYLLEEMAVTIHHITLIHSHKRQESDIARIFNEHPVITLLAPGLGASDDPGLTHIVRLHHLTISHLHNLLPIEGT